MGVSRRRSSTRQKRKVCVMHSLAPPASRADGGTWQFMQQFGPAFTTPANQRARALFIQQRDRGYCNSIYDQHVTPCVAESSSSAASASASAISSSRKRKRSREEPEGEITVTDTEEGKDEVKAAGAGKKKHKLTSEYTGVCWYKRTQKWVVQIKVGSKRKTVGYFTDEHKAGRAYNKALLELVKQQEKEEVDGSPKTRKRNLNCTPKTSHN